MHTINICKFFKKSDCDFEMIRQWVASANHAAISPSLYPAVDPVGAVMGWMLTVHIDCLRLLQKVNLTQYDLKVITDAVNRFLSGIGLSVEDMQVSRIDYCVNAVVPERQRAVLLKVFQKALRQTFYVKRGQKYIQSVYYKSKSKVVQIYDKTAECRAKGRIPKWYEKDVLRFEVQIKTNHLKYKRRRGVDRSWTAWISWDTRTHYLADALGHTIYEGDYYTLDRAYTRLKHCGIQGVLLDQLRAFMRSISKGRHVEKVFETMSRNTAKRYCNILRRAGVSPIPIPRREKISYLQNPFCSLIGK